MKNSNKQTLYWLPAILIIVAMAACSLVYQLVLAQTMTALFGGTVLRYSITIGLYLFGLGLGVLYVDLAKNEKIAERFFYTQLWLSILGSLGFISVIIFSVWQYDLSVFVLVYAHALVLSIGFLSGVELPLMTHLNQSKFTQTLSFDYWGALMGSVSFPLWLYPIYGLISTALFTALLNWFICLFVAYYFRLNVIIKISAWTFGVFIVALVLQREWLELVLQKIYITGTFHGN